MDNLETTNIPQQQIIPKESVFSKHKRLFLLFLALILAVFTIWAIRTAKYESNTANNSSVNNKPKGKIATLSFTPIDIKTSVNQEFLVDVMIDTGNRNINGADAVITYDVNYLSVKDEDQETPGVQVKNGGLFPNLLINDVDPTTGKIKLTASRLSPKAIAINGQGKLASITFVAKKEGSTDLNFVFDPNKTNTSNVVESKTSNNILTTITQAHVQISK